MLVHPPNRSMCQGKDLQSIKPDDEPAYNTQIRCKKKYTSHIVPYEGVRETPHLLRDQGYPMGIITGAHT